MTSDGWARRLGKVAFHLWQPWAKVLKGYDHIIYELISGYRHEQRARAEERFYGFKPPIEEPHSKENKP